MAIINRDLDPTQQRDVYTTNVSITASGVSAGIANPVLATGITYPLMTVPYPAQLVAAEEAAWGASGTPVHSLWIYRFAGGFTSIAVGQTLTVTAFGTSGALGYSLFGASWLLQTGDQIALYTQGSASAVASTTITVVIKALQDYKTEFGV